MNCNLVFRVLVVSAGAIIINGCDPQPPPAEKTEDKTDLEKQLDDFDERINDINHQMNLVDYLSNEIAEVEKLVNEGRISREQGDKMIREIQEKYDRQMSQQSRAENLSGLSGEIPD